MSTAGLMNFTSPYAKRLAIDNRAAVAIELDDHDPASVYTTGDPLSGQVLVAVPKDMSFTHLQISFEGSVRTLVDNMSPSAVDARTLAAQTFLKLTMPISAASYPENHVFQSGEVYKFPFHFVVPEHLLPSSCNHAVNSSDLQQQHLELPPSMGAKPAGDDLSPDMCRITYQIKTRLVHRLASGKLATLGDNTKTILIVPATQEAPPLSVTRDDKDFVLSRSKTLKKGMFKGKLGTITMASDQPRAFFLPSPSSTEAPSTMAKVKLRFDPATPDALPPRLGSLSNKIRATTIFSSKPLPRVVRRRTSADFDLSCGTYTTTVSLSSRCLAGVSWVKQDKPLQRRDSGYSTLSEGEDEADDARLIVPPAPDRVHYTAEVVVPLTLTASKCWLPSFQSCLAARVYALELALTLHTPAAGPSSTVVLHLPVQVAAAGRTAAELAQRQALAGDAALSIDAAARDADADDAAAERPASPQARRPSVLSRRLSLYYQALETDGDLPPGYDTLLGAASRPIEVRRLG